MPKAIIVGHTGQDGRILWGQLADRGYRLAGLSRAGSNVEGTVSAHAEDAAIENVLSDLVAGFAADEIYYLAACHHGSEGQEGGSRELAENSWHTHVDQFERMLLAARRASPAPRVFYAASSRIFGASEGKPLNEASRLSPQCIYGLTKAGGMQVARYFREAHSMHVSCGILFNHESALRGPRYLSQRVVQGLLDIRSGITNSLTVGSLDAQADWGYAPDYTRAMQLMLARSEPGDLVVATGVLHTVRDFIGCCAQELGVDWTRHIDVAPALLARPAQGLCGDSSALRESTGWAPSVDFETMAASLAREAAVRRAAGAS